MINLVAADDDARSRYNTGRADPDQTDTDDDDDDDDDAVRLFTVLELVVAVVATHLGTVLMFFVVLLPVHCLRAERRRRAQMAVDSLRPVTSSCDFTLNDKAAAMKSTTVRSYHWPDRLDYDAT